MLRLPDVFSSELRTAVATANKCGEAEINFSSLDILLLLLWDGTSSNCGVPRSSEPNNYFDSLSVL